MRRSLTLIPIVATAFLLWFFWPFSDDGARSLKVASAKGGTIAAQTLKLSAAHEQIWLAALSDVNLAPKLANKRLDLLRVVALEETRAAALSCEGHCSELTFYNYSDGGTLTLVYDGLQQRFLASNFDTAARPNPGSYVVNHVVDIAANDGRVEEVLGDLRKARVAMIPMSTWLRDDACNLEWCVDMTFHDPAGSGKIFHVVVNMQQELVARTFFTRGRAERAYQELAQLDPEAPRFSDGCHDAYGWQVCWEMTAHDGVNFYNAEFESTQIFSSVKIGQVEAFYPSWPGGYRDEVGFAATVPPKFDTHVVDLGDGFEVWQMFTEEFNWPNCICCYRYIEVMRFFADGRWQPSFVSEGPGCDELSEYRPFWRINLDLDGAERDQAWQWQGDQWQQVEREQMLPLFGEPSPDRARLLTFDGDLGYRWVPERSDPLGLDDGRLFVVENENVEGIIPGPADTFDPPTSFLNGQSLNSDESDLVIWYIPVLKSKKGGPWWCQPDPEPETSPCTATLNVLPLDELRQPTADELATLRSDQATVEPQETPTAVGAISAIATLRPTPRPIGGSRPDELLLNAGCTACHLIGELGEAGKVGPDLSHIGVAAGERVPGQSARDYLRNSILYPDIYIAEDCPNGACLAGIMPGTYHLTMSEQQVAIVVDYLLDQRSTTNEIVGSTTEASQPPTRSPNSSATPVTSSIGWLMPFIAAGVAVGLLLIVIVLRLLRPTVEQPLSADEPPAGDQ